MSEIKEVPSPFCGVGTDDLVIEVDGLSIKVKENGCSINTPAFEQAITHTSARVDGNEVDLNRAVAQVAELLKTSKQPVIGGCATDVNGMRALLSLADKCGAVVDNQNFSAARNNFLVLQDSGWMNTTLAEVKNRCDLLVVVGTDLEKFAPRFFERYIWNESAMYLEDTSNRQVVYLGKKPSGNASHSPDGRAPQVLPCSDDDLPEVIAVLRALIKGNSIQSETVCDIKLSELTDLVSKLKSAKYSVVTWSAGEMAFSQAELTVQTLCESIKDLNDLNTRCSGLPLSGKEGDQTANQVCGWITGFPARTRFSKGFPEYDPYLNDIEQMLVREEADILVWVQAFNINSVPPTVNIPTIVLGRSGMKFEQEPNVFIPIGTPGIDHMGHAYRMDNVVAIRLKQLRNSGLPNTAEVLTAIERAI